MLVFDQLKKNDTQLRVLTWSVLSGMLILLAGLWYLQVLSSRRYVEDQKSQAYRKVRIPAMRGRILDRNGTPLVENYPNYTISLYLEELTQLFDEEFSRAKPSRFPAAQRPALKAHAHFRVVTHILENLGTSIQAPLSLEFDRFVTHRNNQLALPLPVIQNLTADQMARYHEQAAIPRGIDLEIQPTRTYLHTNTAAHVLGYLQRDDRSAVDEDAFFNFRLPDFRGVVGIENAFDQDLRGKAGIKSVLVNSLGYRQSESIWLPAEPGHDVRLTIDLEVQKAAELALNSAMPSARGAAVVMDCRTGDIIAMASVPSYDPNQFIPRLSHEYAERLIDPKLRPQINRAIQENYAPGSIFKIITGLACLEEGLDPNETIYNPGQIVLGRRRINDLAAAGDYNFEKAFIHSSNTYFITNGLKAGVEAIVRIGRQFHLGERTNLPLPRQEAPGTFPKPEAVRNKAWFEGDTANLCIGQGPVDVTPLQMVVMTAAIANGGKVLWPRLVDRVISRDPDQESPVKVFDETRVRSELDVDPRNLQIIREAMIVDVERGTGKSAAIPGFRIGGKTGTAQVTDSKNRVTDHTTWFVSFGPAESPRYAVVVMVESGSSGGGTCAPLAKQIYLEILKQEQQRSRLALASGNTAH